MATPPRKKVLRPEYSPVAQREPGIARDPLAANVTTSVALQIGTLMAVDAIAYAQGTSRNKILRRAVELGVAEMGREAIS